MDEGNGHVPDALAARIRRLRLEAGLSQRALAKKVGTAQSVIARLENESYHAHSLYILRRIAAALNQDVEVVFSPREKEEA